jgi:hypothetical protein
MIARMHAPGRLLKITALQRVQDLQRGGSGAALDLKSKLRKHKATRTDPKLRRCRRTPKVCCSAAARLCPFFDDARATSIMLPDTLLPNKPPKARLL